MDTFEVHREQDQSGVSGTGVVIEGVMFSTGLCIIHWLTPAPRGSINIFESFEQFMAIHIAPHPTNRATIRFSSGLLIEPDDYVANPSPFNKADKAEKDES